MNETFEIKETNRRKTNEKNNLVNIKQQKKKYQRNKNRIKFAAHNNFS